MNSYKPELFFEFLEEIVVDVPDGHSLGDLIQAHNVLIHDIAHLTPQLLAQPTDVRSGPIKLGVFEMEVECDTGRQIAAKLASNGYRPANLFHTLLAVVRCSELIGDDRPYLALASAISAEGGDHVPCLQSDGDRLELSAEVDDPRDGLLGHYCILAHKIGSS